MRDLDRHFALEFLVIASVDNSKPPGTELGCDPVTAQLGGETRILASGPRGLQARKAAAIVLRVGFLAVATTIIHIDFDELATEGGLFRRRHGTEVILQARSWGAVRSHFPGGFEVIANLIHALFERRRLGSKS
jgi:hypothetical protein